MIVGNLETFGRGCEKCKLVHYRLQSEVNTFLFRNHVF